MESDLCRYWVDIIGDRAETIERVTDPERLRDWLSQIRTILRDIVAVHGPQMSYASRRAIADLDRQIQHYGIPYVPGRTHSVN